MIILPISLQVLFNNGQNGHIFDKEINLTRSVKTSLSHVRTPCRYQRLLLLTLCSNYKMHVDLKIKEEGIVKQKPLK